MSTSSSRHHFPRIAQLEELTERQAAELGAQGARILELEALLADRAGPELPAEGGAARPRRTPRPPVKPG